MSQVCEGGRADPKGQGEGPPPHERGVESDPIWGVEKVKCRWGRNQRKMWEPW